MASVITQPPPAPSERRYSVDEYLDIEADAMRRGDERRYEYVAGEIRSMSGASEPHNLITWNLILAFGQLLRNRPERGYSNTMRVRYGRSGLYYYPDMVISRGRPEIERDRGDTLLNPLAVFEVLSPSTTSIDHGDKKLNYGQIETLTDYVILSQKAVHVEHYTRDVDRIWRSHVLDDLSETLTLAGIEIAVPLAEIYHEIEFDLPEDAPDSSGD